MRRKNQESGKAQSFTKSLPIQIVVESTCLDRPARLADGLELERTPVRLGLSPSPHLRPMRIVLIRSALVPPLLCPATRLGCIGDIITSRRFRQKRCELHAGSCRLPDLVGGKSITSLSENAAIHWWTVGFWEEAVSALPPVLSAKRKQEEFFYLSIQLSRDGVRAGFVGFGVEVLHGDQGVEDADGQCGRAGGPEHPWKADVVDDSSQ